MTARDIFVDRLMADAERYDRQALDCEREAKDRRREANHCRRLAQRLSEPDAGVSEGSRAEGYPCPTCGTTLTLLDGGGWCPECHTVWREFGELPLPETGPFADTANTTDPENGPTALTGRAGGER